MKIPKRFWKGNLTLCLALTAQEEDPLLAQEEDRLLVQEEDA